MTWLLTAIVERNACRRLARRPSASPGMVAA